MSNDHSPVEEDESQVLLVMGLTSRAGLIEELVGGDDRAISQKRHGDLARQLPETIGAQASVQKAGIVHRHKQLVELDQQLVVLSLSQGSRS
jgi:hypothetical protein